MRTWRTSARWTQMLGMVLASPGFAAVLTGCASPGRCGEIPFGEWSGHGEFVYEHWKEDGEKSEESEPQSIHRRYATSLSIRPGRLNDREIIELEIHSHRGTLPDLGDSTHLKVALLRAKRISDSMVLYRLVGLLLNSDADKTLRFDDNAPPFGASCITMDGTTILQIDYIGNFFDTFRFEDGRVEKTGTYFDKEEGLIHWSEQLTRRE